MLRVIRRIFAGALLVTLAAMPLFVRGATPNPEATGGGGLSLDAFEQIVVLESGRKMPLDSFARLRLVQLSGKSTLARESASAWLARVLFTPEKAVGDKVFVISHPQVVRALGLTPESRRRYSYAQLEPGLDKLSELSRTVAHMDEERRSVIENEILRVAHNVNTFRGMRDSFTFAIPHPNLVVRHPVVGEALGLDSGDTPQHALDLSLTLSRAREVLGQVDDLAPEAEEEFSRLSAELNGMLERRRNLPPAIIPVSVHEDELWLSPWAVLTVAGRRPEVSRQVELLGDMVAAYQDGAQLEFDLAARGFADAVREQAAPDRQLKHTDLELLYNRLDLFYRCELLYGLAFLAGLVALVSGKRGFRMVALLLLVIGIGLHAAGIALRMNIMGRPPVTNLYSTFIFVAWVSALLCAVWEKVQKNSLGVVAGGISGLTLLLLSRRFVSMSDPMGVLVAVLDSNFWLTTHVITITMGYAGCCLAGVIGHFYLLQAAINPLNKARLRSLYVAMFAVLGFGLTFSFLGTMLGGVWADQSWGRFWGWDPKENGALLIVIWCAVLFHARISKMIGDIGMAAGSILGIIVVLFAWVGVNLLGVGLHSYGFTSGVAVGLFGYTFAQLGLLCLLVLLAKLRMKRAAAASAPLNS